MTVKRKSKHPVITMGLYAHIEKYKLDGRTKPVQQMARARVALCQLFPQGVNAPAALIIERVLYKALKLSIYEAMDLAGEPMTPGGEQKYLTMANSLREDLRILTALADRKPPEGGVPSLQEYLASLKQTGSEGPCES